MTSHGLYTKLVLTLTLATLCFSPANAATPDKQNVDIATKFFLENCKDKPKLRIILTSLQSVGSNVTTSFFTSLTRSGDKSLRLFATAVLSQSNDKEAILALKERLTSDTSMVVRAEALLGLKKLDAVDRKLLISNLRVDDEAVQVMAAKGLVSLGHNEDALETLNRLTSSKDTDTSTLARMTLLATGDKKQIAYLRKIITNKSTPDNLLIRILAQIRNSKITSAAPVASYLSSPTKSMAVRIHAFKTMTILSPKTAAQKLIDAIRKSDNLIMQCNMIKILTGIESPSQYLEQLSNLKGSANDIIQFELVAPKGGSAAEKALARMIKPGHPILIDHALFKMHETITAKKGDASYFINPIIQYIKTATINPRIMTPTNRRVSQSIALIGNIGNTRSNSVLKEIINDNETSSISKLAIGALFSCKSAKACDIIRPFSNSPYEKQMRYSTLTLAKHGDPGAIIPLQKIQSSSLKSETELKTLVNWYILKFANAEKKVLSLTAKEILKK